MEQGCTYKSAILAEIQRFQFAELDLHNGIVNENEYTLRRWNSHLSMNNFSSLFDTTFGTSPFECSIKWASLYTAFESRSIKSGLFIER